MNRPERKVMSMVPNRSYLEGYNDCVEETTAYCERLEDMLRRVLDAQTPKVDTPEERVLRAQAFELLGDPLADYIGG